MANINEILARAAALRDETALNSISPERAGGIMYDTLMALNELWLQQGAALVISKIYASVDAMEADTDPVSDISGKPLRPGQIVVIASEDEDNGSVYRYNGPDSPSWSLVGEIGNLEPVDSLDSDSTQLPLAAHQGKVLDGKISQLGQELEEEIDSKAGVFEPSSQYIYAITDSARRLIAGIKSDGSIDWSTGVPTPIQERIEQVEDEIDSKAGVFEPSYEYIYVITDSERRVIAGIKSDGSIDWSIGVPTPIQERIEQEIQTSIAEYVSKRNNFEFLFSLVDKEEKIVEGLKSSGERFFPTPIIVNNSLEFGEAGLFGYKASNKIREAISKDDFSKDFVLPDYSRIIATFDNIIVRFFTENNTEYLSFSNNLGASWSTPIENTIGDIVHTHIFSNGDILLCNRNGAYYISAPYTELVQSVVLDIDGEPYNEPNRRGFFSEMYHDQYFFVDDIEMDIWGEYVLEDETTPREDLNARIWYTIDNGRTVKCAFKSGTTAIDGNIITIRHFHYIGYCEKTNKFYASTGDNVDETYLLELQYDILNDGYSFDILGSGSQFKYGYHWYDNKYAYFLTDFTSGLNPEKKGILRCPLNQLTDFTKYINLYVCPPEEWGNIAIVNIYMFENGVKVLFPDYLGAGVIWVAESGYNFKKVSLNKQELIGFNVLGPNLNGELVALARGGEMTHRINDLQYSLSELLKNNGIKI